MTPAPHFIVQGQKWSTLTQAVVKLQFFVLRITFPISFHINFSPFCFAQHDPWGETGQELAFT